MNGMLNIAVVDPHSIWMTIFSVIVYVSGSVFLIGSGIYLYAARDGFTPESEDLRGLGSLIAFFSGVPLAICTIISLVAGAIWGMSSAMNAAPSTALAIIGITIIAGFMLIVLADIVANIK